MAKQAAATAEAPAADAVAAPKGGLSMIKIGGIVAGLMIVECVAIIMVMPRSSEPAAAAQAGDEHGEENGEAEHAEAPAADAGGHGGHGKPAKEAKGHGKHGEEHSAGPAKSPTASEELDLGEFSVTSYQPASNTTLFISFHLFGTLLHKNSEELEHRLEDNRHRVRDNIIVIIRSAEIPDLTDAGLGLIKRRILETTNKTLGKPLLQAVVFSEFSFIEQ